MIVTVKYFGMIQDCTKIDHEEIEFYEKTLKDLEDIIIDIYPELKFYTYKIAVNCEFKPHDYVIQPNDEIAFLPPFAGG
ncbi:MAG: hypothetical protein Kow0079_13130 [Vicingaceae bacterium]